MPSNASLNKAVLAAAAVALGGAILLSSQLSGNVTICSVDGNSCQTLTRVEYQEVRQSFASKLEGNVPLSWDEYKLMITVLNKEIRDGGLELENVVGDADIKQGLINKLREE